MTRRLKIVDDSKERKLPLRRERSLWLIKNVYPLLEAIGKESQKGFTVRLLVQ